MQTFQLSIQIDPENIQEAQNIVKTLSIMLDMLSFLESNKKIVDQFLENLKTRKNNRIMQTYQFTIRIEAQTSEEAKQIVAALIDLKKSMTTPDLLLFSRKIKEKPALVQKAKMFI